MDSAMPKKNLTAVFVDKVTLPERASMPDLAQMPQEVAVKNDAKPGGRWAEGGTGGPVTADSLFKVLRGVKSGDGARHHRGRSGHPRQAPVAPCIPRLGSVRRRGSDEVPAMRAAVLDIGCPFGHWAHLLLITGQRRTAGGQTVARGSGV